jgi:hypothetical protein
MNPRIQELAEQAKASMPAGLVVERWIELYNQEFARLIVRECVKVMYDNAIDRQIPLDIERTPTHYAAAILEHFRINED